MVTRLGFEPKTHSLEGCCSIQLSYQAVTIAGAKVRIFSILSTKKVKNHLGLDFLTCNTLPWKGMSSVSTMAL